MPTFRFHAHYLDRAGDLQTIPVWALGAADVPARAASHLRRGERLLEVDLIPDVVSELETLRFLTAAERAAFAERAAA